MTISSTAAAAAAVEAFPCSEFSHLLSSAVRKDRELLPVAAGDDDDVGEGEAEAVVGLCLVLPILLTRPRQVGMTTAVVPAVVRATSSTSPSDTGVREDREDEEDEEEEEEEEAEEDTNDDDEEKQDAVESGDSSQLFRGKDRRDEAGTKPTLGSANDVASRRRLEKHRSLLEASSGRSSDALSAAGLKRSSVTRPRLLRLPSCGLGVSGTMMDRSP